MDWRDWMDAVAGGVAFAVITVGIVWGVPLMGEVFGP